MLRYGVEMGDEAVGHLRGQQGWGWDPGRSWGRLKSWVFEGGLAHSHFCWVTMGK